MIDLGRETDGNNKICLGVHFALCIIKSSATRSYWALFLGRWSPFFILSKKKKIKATEEIRKFKKNKQ